MKRFSLSITLFALLIVPLTSTALAKTIQESAREIPIAYEVDVVVVGGSAAGVAAAVEASQNGASVFLAAPRPYLGEDLCAPYRLWLEPGEEPSTPFTQKLFAEPLSEILPERGLQFTYEADQPSDAKHKDTDKASLLNDGKFTSSSSQSVQYNNDVVITVDLGQERNVKKAHIMAYQRNNEFSVDNVAISISADKNEWHEIAVVKNSLVGRGTFEEQPIDLSNSINQKTRYLKFSMKKGADAQRILLGEILLETDVQKQDRKASLRIPPTLMQIKYALDQALLDAKVQFLYSCMTTDILHDENGKIAGIVMVNRSGRQAVLAKVVIDAMPRAGAARMAGAEFASYPAGEATFKRIVVGGTPREDEAARKMPTQVHTKDMAYDATEYTMQIPMPDASYASFANADQIMRDRTWQTGQVNASETLFQIPPDPVRGQKSIADWPGADNIDLDAFKPKDIPQLYILGACADISRNAAEKLVRPLNLIAVATRIGKAAAQEAAALSMPKGVTLKGPQNADITTGNIRELLQGVRPISESARSIPSTQRAIPILGQYDVVVIGGGTGGAPAGIGAARKGAKTLVVEYLHGLGGVGTLGLIGRYYHGYREGFTKELDEGVLTLGKDPNVKHGGWNVENKIEWYRSELRKAGADLWYGVLGCGAYVVDGSVKGVVVATPFGRGVILCQTAIDSTGSSDIAIAAGADYQFTGPEHAALQGTGLPPRRPGANYTNTDYTFVDDTDPVDLWRSFIVAKEKFSGEYDLGQIVDTRERRRIVGDFFITPVDIMNHRTYPDTISIARSNFDTHGYTVHAAFLIKNPDKVSVDANTPYRALLPKGLDGIIVTGLGISAHRDAMPILRMQPCIQNQGYAMGIAASMAAKDNLKTRDVDIKKLQEQLVEIGSLPTRVLTDQDSYPLSQDTIAQAVQNAADDYKDLPLILSQSKDSLVLLRKAYSSADDLNKKLEDQTRERISSADATTKKEPKLIYAHILGMLGDQTGSKTLCDAVAEQEWDEGWRFTGMGQFGGSLSALDSLIIALGRTRDPRALPIILDKLEQLSSQDAFSHHRAIAVALESMGDRKAAKPIAELLKKPGMTGHAYSDVAVGKSITPKGFNNDTTTREVTLRELVLARALYRCGDYQGLGEKILRQYQSDLRGHLARHANAVLKQK